MEEKEETNARGVSLLWVGLLGISKSESFFVPESRQGKDHD